MELKAILFGLRSLCDHIYGSHSHIKLISDNTTAVHCINNMGSCRSLDCDKIKNSIWDWAIKRRLWLSSAHIPGRLQREAEQKSRKTEWRIEWKLNRTIFDNMLGYFQHFKQSGTACHEFLVKRYSETVLTTY